MPRIPSARLGAFLALLLLPCLRPAPASAAESRDSDPETAGYLERYRRGMSIDSLYWLLAGQGLRRLSFDTAMAFNLSIPTPPPGAFRDSVLAQRYRLYLLSGLHEDAAALKDSLPAANLAARPGRRMEWEARLYSGYGREDQVGARAYPAGLPLDPIRSEGWLARHQASATLPLPTGPVPLSAGLGYDVAKSYYKDSLDYRGEARLKADRIAGGLSAALTAEAGRITGLGPVTAWKAEATWLVLGKGGFLLASGGYESEWEGLETRRYDVAWLSAFREWGRPGGRSAHASLAGTWLRMDALDLPGSHPVIFVDDASRPAPTHYADATYRDSLSRFRAVAYMEYTGHTGALAFRCPQEAFALSPGAGFAWPAGAGLVAEVSAAYSLTWYPSRYRWLQQPGGDPFAGDSSTFHAFARSRADGKYYPAYLDNRGGSLREAYGVDPLVERSEIRKDHRLQAGLALKRSFAGMGALAFDMGVRRTFSSLAGEAPLWVPEWELDASIRWSMAGGRP